MVLLKHKEPDHHVHTPEAIQERLEEGVSHNYIGDFLLGAIDGCVTTFAIVAGVAGAGLPKTISIILGVSNLLADGFSMAAGTFQKAKSDQEILEKARRMEERHIKEVPEGEREEVRQIFLKKGFKGDILEDIVKVITSDKDRWVNTMLTEELGLRLDIPDPYRSALTTFWAFTLVGLIPLLPFILPLPLSGQQTFLISAVATGLAFFFIGLIKARETAKPKLFAGFETLFIGGSAAVLAYLVGYWLKSLIGISFI